MRQHDGPDGGRERLRHETGSCQASDENRVASGPEQGERYRPTRDRVDAVAGAIKDDGEGDGRQAPAPVVGADSLQPKGTRLLLVEISAPYRPVTGASLFGDGGPGFLITRKTLWPVRYGRRYASMSPEVVLGSGASCPPR